MRIYFFEWNKAIQCTHTEWCVQYPKPAGPSALDKHQIQASALDLSYFTSKSKCKFINLNYLYTIEKQNHLIMFVKIINKMALECHSTWRILTTLPSEKNGSVDVTFTRAVTHQKHLAQSGGSTRNAVDIFNTLHVFTKEPIREQGFKGFSWGGYGFADRFMILTYLCPII